MSPAPGVLRPGLPQPWQGFLTYLLTLLTHWQGRNDICTGRVCLSCRRDLSEAGREAVSLAVWASEGLCQQGQGCIRISFSELPGEAAERPQTHEGPAGSLPRRARCLEGGGEAGPKSQPTAQRVGLPSPSPACPQQARFPAQARGRTAHLPQAQACHLELFSRPMQSKASQACLCAPQPWGHPIQTQPCPGHVVGLLWAGEALPKAKQMLRAPAASEPLSTQPPLGGSAGLKGAMALSSQAAGPAVLVVPQAPRSLTQGLPSPWCQALCAFWAFDLTPAL